MREIAKLMRISLTTVEREWSFARSWIQCRVQEQ